ncbi:MAG: penicillin-binding protein 2 [Actinomycetota bacterium]|nr:penicillin-binding protein 2 [Actinomycetota bacterium]
MSKPWDNVRLRIKLRETTYSKPDAEHERIKRRMKILGIIAIVAFGILVTRLWFMQIVSGEEYRKKAESNRIRQVSLEAARGRILDRKDRTLAKNSNTLTVSVVPAELDDEGGVVERLSKLLGMGEREIAKKIEESQAPNQRAVLIKSEVSPDIVTYIAEHQREFRGVIAGTKAVRNYPYHSLAAHTLGYLGQVSEEVLSEKKEKGYTAGDEVGISGVEATYDEFLRGKAGELRLEVDAQGNFVREISRREAVPGNDLRLTIDLDVQAQVEEALRWGVELARTHTDAESGKKYEAPGASVVVLDPKNGEIIAMASYPTFDLNEFAGGISEEAWKTLNDPKNDFPLNNRPIMSEIPPGSTFKVVSALGALNESMYKTDSAFVCNHVFEKGAFKDFPKYCWSEHGRINLFNGIVESCDVVFYEIGYSFFLRQSQDVGKTLWQYASDFQLGKTTGVDLVGEKDGRVPNPEWKKEFNKNRPQYQAWYPGDTVNMAIGQGDLLATPLQMACLYAGIANGGKFVKPRLAKQVTEEGNKAAKESSPELRAVLDIPDIYLDQVSRALSGVVQGRGTASATFDGFPLGAIPVAGKTGTSEIAGKQPTAWFVCYAPVGDPKYVVAVAIEEGGHGGQSAAPVARRILEVLFNVEARGEIKPSLGD